VSKKKIILAVVLPVTITIVFAWANLILPHRDAIVAVVAAFVGALVGYQWKKRDNPTFGRMIVWALVVAGVAAAMFVSSNLLARYVF